MCPCSSGAGRAAGRTGRVLSCVMTAPWEWEAVKMGKRGLTQFCMGRGSVWQWAQWQWVLFLGAAAPAAVLIPASQASPGLLGRTGHAVHGAPCNI